MNIANFIDYMSFFFVGKYVNTNNISTRNIAPDLDNKKDIYQKTAKLINMALNDFFSKKYSFSCNQNVFINLAFLNTFNSFTPETLVSDFSSVDLNINLTKSERRKSNNQLESLANYTRYTNALEFSISPFTKNINNFIKVTDEHSLSFLMKMIFCIDINSTTYPSYSGTSVTNFINKLRNNEINVFISKRKYTNSFFNVLQFISNKLRFYSLIRPDIPNTGFNLNPSLRFLHSPMVRFSLFNPRDDDYQSKKSFHSSILDKTRCKTLELVSLDLDKFYQEGHHKDGLIKNINLIQNNSKIDLNFIHELVNNHESGSVSLKKTSVFSEYIEGFYYIYRNPIDLFISLKNGDEEYDILLSSSQDLINKSYEFSVGQEVSFCVNSFSSYPNFSASINYIKDCFHTIGELSDV